MDAVSGWLFQKQASNSLGSVTKDLDAATNDLADSVTNWWHGMVGKTQPPLAAILDEFEIPKGIFPKTISKYNFQPAEGEERAGLLKVTLPFICEVRFSDGHTIRYDKVVECRVTKGSLDDILGMKSQGILWAVVTAVTIKPGASDKIYFQLGSKKMKLVANYTHAREGVEVQKF
eukprot:TRINITY_DN38706_c0_g1_i1.p1 TRINITY_DN38706_c0_g1~~TRINITY_DN38706_c0_g1_i1.p1  ORF type:complete len:175 (+),score=20.91 TRINITY_DN38706_c0_g1_i1:201-725(+)